MSDYETIHCATRSHQHLTGSCPNCEIERLRSENMCDVCAGTGEVGTEAMHVSGSAPTCICGGSGKMSDAAVNLRIELAKAEAERDAMRADAASLLRLVRTYITDHDAGCAVFVHPSNYCDCGYDDACAATDAEREPQP